METKKSTNEMSRYDHILTVTNEDGLAEIKVGVDLFNVLIVSHMSPVVGGDYAYVRISKTDARVAIDMTEEDLINLSNGLEHVIKSMQTARLQRAVNAVKGYENVKLVNV